MPQLGAILQEWGIISAQQLREALRLQRKSASRIGDILLADGAITNLPLYCALAKQSGRSFVDLRSDAPERRLCHARHMHDYIRLRALPWRKNKNGITLIATSEPDNPKLHAWLNKRYGNLWRCVLASPLDIRLSIEHLFKGRLSTESRTLLYARHPDRSARYTLTAEQKITFIFLFALLAGGIYLAPWEMLIGSVITLHFLYAITMLLKGSIFHIGRKAIRRKRKRYVQAIPDHALPVYTILVPLYREADSLPFLLNSLRQLDYPAAKLDIKLILEADDTATIAAAERLRIAYNFEILRVPPSMPRTKPKACNYGLKFARGAYVTIYDAEDRPEPLQLRKAVRAFRSAPKDVICLQARLRYYNADENWLTRLFELEYRILFDTLLPGLQALGIPLPLGGTSNHFRVKQLRKLGEWDPYNVTEDADLGVRIAAAGYRTRMLNSYTLEEAPLHLRSWLNQRSRWIKGYMQTWCVHMRHPKRLLNEIGVVPFMGLQFFMGVSTLSFLTAPLVWLVSVLFLTGIPHVQGVTMPWWFSGLSAFNLLLFLCLHWQQAFQLAPKQGRERLRFIAAVGIFPLYWCLHSLASYKALWQLVWKPHFWEKTTHGVSKIVKAENRLKRARLRRAQPSCARNQPSRFPLRPAFRRSAAL